MMKYLFVLAIGIGGGYYFGFADGTAGKPSIVTRIVERVGGNSRQRVANDIDAVMERVEGNKSTDPKKVSKAP
jgi:hypothetical protein